MCSYSATVPFGSGKLIEGMGWYSELVKKAGHARWFTAVAGRLAPPADRSLHRLTGGRVLSTGPAILPTMLLTTIGRRSGKERIVPLLYVRDGDRLVVAGSNWGQKRHPAWSENLLANPRARVEMGREAVEYRARLSSGEERERLWPRLVEIWPAYETYRRRSGREIRVFVLEPDR